MKASTFYDTSAPVKTRKSSTKPTTKEPNAGSSSDEAYNVEDILDHKMEKTQKGKMTKFYYIKWEGDYEHSWEPEAHVGTAAIELYEAKLQTKQKSWGAAGGSGTMTRMDVPSAPRILGKAIAAYGCRWDFVC